jgi:hypothetical protein
MDLFHSLKGSPVVYLTRILKQATKILYWGGFRNSDSWVFSGLKYYFDREKITVAVCESKKNRIVSEVNRSYENRNLIFKYR